MKTIPRALPIIAGIFAAVFSPPAPITPSAWANQHFFLPDGERKSQLIDLSRTPHLVEPLDALGPDAPDNEIAVMKSAQSAFTTLLQIAACHSIDRDPCDMMIVQPTDSALGDFNSQKLGRALELSPIMRKKVFPQTARAGNASKTYEKKFSPDCSLFLSLASSTADLRSKTIKKALCDEIDEYPADLNDQGDPLDMIRARQISFLRSGTWKRAYFSTPTIKGASSIESKFEAGDQRRWTMVCPHCDDDNLQFEWSEKNRHFEFDPKPPYRARYIPPCCGVVIEGWQKFAVYATGRWVATAPGEGRYKSYHFDALSSPFVPWDEIAKEYVAAGDNPIKLKAFWNLTLGLPFELKGEAPEFDRLLARREDYKQGHVPARGLLFVMGADVQHTGIWVEGVAFASNGESWSVVHDFLEGDTTDHKGGAFAKLEKLYDQKFPDAFGGTRLVDCMAIDAGDGGRANQVYRFCRGRARAFAIKGVSGWSAPAIGTPIQVDIKLSGKKIKKGATLWPVGTWALKATFYSNLVKDGRRAGAEQDPDGYCHHHAGCDERYFKQQTAEYLKTTVRRGRTVKEWQETGPNHLLDCRIYAMAMAEYLGLSRLTADQWAAIAKERGVPQVLQQPDLLAPDAVKIAAAEPAPVRPLLTRRPKKRGMTIHSRGVF
ncbi:phage terminase large subunit family protein [Bradyrhizobium xenonodulans]|uniref:Phage terminase large subunit family protein n=1 Tax=Bradyrhizobium xenonodulans TaxID=2736875 RepID=A0ABY7MBJ9_9BRAD|nr:terminase gpA endonuclease subunit [Bradyrhizobium xenonodulans]WBL75613.1 phage terminase large subunit family protein [Bradyrhizobium xenonodulans]